MREIKFRAWDEHGKKWEIDNIFLAETGSVWRVNRINPKAVMNLTNLKPVFYTGLKDNNGVKIYEGDIISERVTYRGESEDQLYIVVWRDGYGEFSFQNIKDRDRITPCFEVCTFAKVIGNIYENPELLEV